MVDRAALLKALRDLGYAPEEGLVEIRGYQGIRTAVEIRIPTQNPDYDIGFRKVSERFECVADWFGLRAINQAEFIQQLTQRYAYHVAVEQLTAQGFALASETKQRDGQIHLVLRRIA